MRFMLAAHKHGPANGQCTSHDDIRQNFLNSKILNS
jgi:hypothetical protein